MIDAKKLLEGTTEGPWHVGKDPDAGIGRGWFVGGGGYARAEMTGPPEDTEANARLIAAAPDLAARVVELEAEVKRLQAPRPDVYAQGICAALRQEGYFVPYTVMMRAMLAAPEEGK